LRSGSLIACVQSFSNLYYGELLVNVRISAADRTRSDVSVVVEGKSYMALWACLPIA